MKPQKLCAIDFIQSGGILFSQKSNDYWVGWGKSNRQNRPSAQGLSFYVPDFFLKDTKPWRTFSKGCRLTANDLISLLEVFESEVSELEEKGSDLSGTVIHWNPAQFEEFRTAFLDLKQQFKLGKLVKAVPIVLEEGEIRLEKPQSEGDPHSRFNVAPSPVSSPNHEAPSPISSSPNHGAPSPISLISLLKNRAQLLRNLLQNTQNFPLYLYGWWDEEEGIMGATPEILFEQTEPGLLTTVAIAGTRSKKRPALGGLLNDPKEMEEHRIVIQGIQESLSDLGNVKVGQTCELELPTLFHLMTPMTVAADCSFENYVQRLHPTPALGAFPRAPGQEWLKNYPLNSRRNRMGAPFGAVWDSGESLCVVAIRNLQWQGHRWLIAAGCGVVAASDLERECEELRTKIQSVKRSFGLS